ncbi:MAG: hypothetical protein CV089_09875 [Nitrospira sp. WS110]|nr:hypothetical protein [Nitrospira sp. WS110]
MTPNRIDESANRNGSEGWHCPDCQSWGPFTVDLITRVMLRDEGTHVLEDDGDTDYDDSAFAMCEVCQRQAPVAAFRCEPVMMDDAERQARARWTRQGVDHTTQDKIVADLTAKAQPGAWVGPFQIPDESPTVGTERTPS